MSEEKRHQATIVVVGEPRIGKTQLVRRFMNLDFIENSEVTDGIDTWRLEVLISGEKKKFILNLWDVEGIMYHLDLRLRVWRMADGAVGIYNIADKHTLDKLDGYIQEIRRYGKKCRFISVVGNQRDRESEREVTQQDGLAVARAHGVWRFYEVSAMKDPKPSSFFADMCCAFLNREIEPDYSLGKKKQSKHYKSLDDALKKFKPG